MSYYGSKGDTNINYLKEKESRYGMDGQMKMEI